MLTNLAILQRALQPNDKGSPCFPDEESLFVKSCAPLTEPQPSSGLILDLTFVVQILLGYCKFYVEVNLQRGQAERPF